MYPLPHPGEVRSIIHPVCAYEETEARGELGNPTKRRELSAAPSAVCPPAGGRTSTWLQETQPEPPWHLTPLPTQLLACDHLQRPLHQPCFSDTPCCSDLQ
nr:phospholemman isoform X5 [Rattus norvegicus]